MELTVNLSLLHALKLLKAMIRQDGRLGLEERLITNIVDAVETKEKE